MPTRRAIWAWLRPFEVREPEQQPLAGVEDVEAAGERDPVLAQLVAALERAVAVELSVLAVHELGDSGSQRRIQLLEPARDPDRPGSIPKVPLDLAVDRRDRVGRQVDAALELEPVDRLDQADRADLDEILELLAVPDMAPGEPAYEREVLLDQARSRAEVTVPVVLAQQSTHGRTACCRGSGPSSNRAPDVRRTRRSACCHGSCDGHPLPLETTDWLATIAP